MRPVRSKARSGVKQYQSGEKGKGKPIGRERRNNNRRGKRENPGTEIHFSSDARNLFLKKGGKKTVAIRGGACRVKKKNAPNEFSFRKRAEDGRTEGKDRLPARGSGQRRGRGLSMERRGHLGNRGFREETMLWQLSVRCFTQHRKHIMQNS